MLTICLAGIIAVIAVIAVVVGRKGELMLKHTGAFSAVVAGLAIASCGGATNKVKSSSPGSVSPVSALNQLPASDFPATLIRIQPPESGSVTFRMSFLGHPITLSASTVSVSSGQVATVARNSSDFVVRFTRLRYRVAPIKLPNGVTVAGATIALNPTAQSTLRLDRHTGALTSDMRWVIDAPNATFNGSHAIVLPDKAPRRILSFKQTGLGRYSLTIRSMWHGSVMLTRWSVARNALPGGALTMAATSTGYYVLNVKHS